MKRYWTSAEVDVFNSLWKDKTVMPTSEEIKAMQQKLQRSAAVLRARAHNIIFGKIKKNTFM